MARFRFSLKSVEKYRNILLDEAKGKYAKATQDINKQKEKILKIEEQIADINSELNQKNFQGTSILEIQSTKQYIKVLENKLEEENDKLKGLQKIEARRRAELVEAKTDAMSIEKIKEKRIEEFKAEEAKKEELAIQEFVSNQISGRNKE